MESSFNHQSSIFFWNVERFRKPTITIHSLVRDMKDCLLRSRPVSSLVCEDCHCCVTAEFLCQGCQCDNLGWRGGGDGGTGLHKLHVIGWEHSKMAVWAVASPPALVYHLDPGDDFIRIEWDLGVVSWRTGAVMNISKVTVWYTFSNTTLWEF